MYALPNGFTRRATAWDDAQAVTDMIIAVDMDETGKPAFSIDDLKSMWQRKDFDLANDAWLVVAPDGTPAGYGDVCVRDDIVRFNNVSGAHPSYKNLGIDAWLLERAEDWVRARFPDRDTVMRHVVNAHVPDKLARMERRGYHAVRQAWLMRIDLDTPSPAPMVPPGITLRPFERGRDEHVAHACVQETFRDLWQHQDVPYDEWANFVINHASWNPDLSYLAFDGDEIAAASFVMVYPNESWIQQFGVRRPYRKQGLGLALLHTIFGELYRRGLRPAGLEVDAENPSGALRLYERAGMHVSQQYTEFRKTVPASVPVSA